MSSGSPGRTDEPTIAFPAHLGHVSDTERIFAAVGPRGSPSGIPVLTAQFLKSDAEPVL
jgi:hypothetical protein